jgi:glycosyltransferase involved in cell wall biosynthesis
MQSPIFSIITPTYKRPALICRNIRSVINQTYSDYEHIIVGDNCDDDDDTAKQISCFNDERIIFLKNERAKGPAGAYNTGILKSRGRFLLFLDDDDEYYPEFLDRMLYSFSKVKSDVGFIWSGIMLIKQDINRQKFSKIIWPEKIISTEKGIACATSIGNGFGLCIRREAQDKIGFYNENLKLGSDTDYLIRLVMNYTFSIIPEVLVKIYCNNENQLTAETNDHERIRVKEIILKKYDAFLREHPKVYNIQYSGYADLCYKQDLYQKGRKAMLSALTAQPLRIKNYFDFFSYELTGKNFGSTSLGKSIKLLIG